MNQSERNANLRFVQNRAAPVKCEKPKPGVRITPAELAAKEAEIRREIAEFDRKYHVRKRTVRQAGHTSAAWAVEWHSRNRLDGDQRWLVCRPRPPYVWLWKTKRECCEWIEAMYGYIRTRPDLRAEPHGWSVPKAVKVNVQITKAAK